MNQKSNSRMTRFIRCSSAISGSSLSAVSAVATASPSFVSGRAVVCNWMAWNTVLIVLSATWTMFVTGRGIHFAMRLSSHWPRFRS
jgi:hypothetical protein